MKSFTLLAVAFLLLAGCAEKDADPTVAPPATNDTAGDAAPEPVAVAVSLFDRTPGAGVPPTTMGISPNTLSLKLGVPVNLTITNDGASAHDLVIEGLEVDTDNIPPGESLSIVFTPMEAGDHVMYCSVGGDSPVGHSGQGMHGTVTVA